MTRFVGQNYFEKGCRGKVQEAIPKGMVDSLFISWFMDLSISEKSTKMARGIRSWRLVPFSLIFLKTVKLRVFRIPFYLGMRGILFTDNFCQNSCKLLFVPTVYVGIL